MPREEDCRTSGSYCTDVTEERCATASSIREGVGIAVVHSRADGPIKRRRVRLTKTENGMFPQRGCKGSVISLSLFRSAQIDRAAATMIARVVRRGGDAAMSGNT